MKINLEHEVIAKEKNHEYIYTYEKDDYTLDKKMLVKYRKYIRVKCLYCGKEYDTNYNSFVRRKYNCSHCCSKYEDSFAYYIQIELGEPLDKHWSNKNKLNPSLIGKYSNINVLIKCSEKIPHDEYYTTCREFAKGQQIPYYSSKKVYPNKSFAQYHINNTDKDFIEKYWSDKNILDPWKVSICSAKRIYINCNNNKIHGSYEISCANFTKGRRCPYCNPSASGKVHPSESFGALYPHESKYWDYNKNDITPFEVAKGSGKKFWFICEDCGESFKRMLRSVADGRCSVKCRNCNSSKGERKIYSVLNDDMNLKENIDFYTQKEYDHLHGVNGGNLSYDFYIPYLNLLIEYQGEQHERYIPGFHENLDQFKKQQEHDRRKKEYAKAIEVDLLEIWYWDFDNIENILMHEVNKLNQEDFQYDVIQYGLC